MAQIFASEKTTPASKNTAAARKAPDDRLQALQTQADASPATNKLVQMQSKTLQRVEEEEAMQGKFSEPVQRMEDEELLQGKFTDPIQRMEDEDLMQGKFSEPVQRNETGMPDNLKSGIETLSSTSMDHVRVHRNSPKPAQVQAHAYAQGSNIHVAPGQEKHLPHEAWHVVQQAQGRVKPTMQMQGVAVNDDAGLEREADVMGAKAMQMADKTSKS